MRCAQSRGAMAKMNWGRVRYETSMVRHGWHRAEETYGLSKKTKKAKKQKPVQRQSTAALPLKAAARRAKKQAAHEALIKRQRQKAEKRKETRRLQHEARIAKIRETKKTQKLNPLREAANAARRLATQERRKARQHREASLAKVIVVRKVGNKELVSALHIPAQPSPTPQKDQEVIGSDKRS